MGVQKAKTAGNLNLDYNSMKIKKNWKMKLMGIGGKIDKANNEIKAACGDSKSNASDVKDGVKDANIGAESADKSEYEVTDGESLALDGENQAATGETDAAAGQVQSDDGQAIVDESPTIEAMQAETNEKIAAMTDGLSGQQEEVMAQLQTQMEIIAAAGEQLTANAAEVDALQAELAEIMPDGAEGGEFSTNMAAAGGQNSAYSLSVPTGTTQAPQAGKAKKGGLISSGAQPTQQPQQGQQAQGGQSADATKTARAQEIYARLVEINEQNCTIQDTITTASDEAMVLQTTVTELMETQSTEVTEDQATAEESNTKSMETLAKFQEISTVGTLVNVAGGVIKGVGRGVAATGLTIEKTGDTVGGKGKAVSTFGKFLKGMFGGVKATGTAVAAIFPIFTGAPGGAVATTGVSGQASGTSVHMTGEGVVVTGKNVKFAGGTVNKTGVDIAKVGQGVKVTGQAIQTVGSAGTAVVGIQQGNWSAIIGGAVGFLGAAASCVGNVGQFAQTLGAAKDGFFGACAQMQSTIANALGNAGSLSSIASKGTQMGNTALQNGTAGFQDMVMNAATTFVPEAGALKSNNTAPTTGNTTGTTSTTSTTKEESSEPTVQVETKISTPAMKAKAKNAGLTDDQIKGKSDSEIQKLIDEKNATNKPKA